MNLIKLKINQEPIEYSIHIGSEIINKEISNINDIGNYNQILVIFDSKIDSQFINLVEQSLLDNNIRFNKLSLDSSKESKSFSTFNRINDYLVNHNYNRDSLLISFGGGSIGDLVGFVASNYYRGIDYIQIPSTLLSMIDSSIGGKTGIDTPSGKNLIGSFYHPRKVIIDTQLISSLDDSEINSGLFEAIKYAILFNLDLFNLIDCNLDNIRDLDIMSQIITQCCKMKSQVVLDDEKDLCNRKKLNFGHTIGHAIESIYGFRHGESVGYGMLCAIDISKQLGTLSESNHKKIFNLIHRLDLPNLNPDVDLIINQLKKDKKIEDNKNNFILLNHIGNSYISNKVSIDMIKNSISNL